MRPDEERKFFNLTDNSFKITLLLAHLKPVNRFIVLIANLLFMLIKSITGRGNNITNRLVVICLHRLGDTVFCIPALEGIFNCYKNYEIFIISYPETKSILSLRFAEDKIHTVNKSDFKLQRRIATRKSKMVLKELKPEIIFDLTGSPTSASLILNSGAREIIGINLEYFKTLYTTFTPTRTKPHFIDIYNDVLKSVKPNYKEYSFEFNINAGTDGYVIIHPFAIRKAKEWGIHKYIELAGRLNKYYNVIVISPPNFIDDDILFEIDSMQIDLQITNTIDELIRVTQKAALFISNDSGPIYIASLLGKPTFTIYGPTNPKFSLPFGAYHKYYQKILSCSASDEKYCFTLGGINCPSQECLNLISVNEVENEIKKFIKELSIEKKTAK